MKIKGKKGVNVDALTKTWTTPHGSEHEDDDAEKGEKDEKENENAEIRRKRTVVRRSTSRGITDIKQIEILKPKHCWDDGKYL